MITKLPPASARAGTTWSRWTRRLAVTVCVISYVLVLAGANLLTSTLGQVPAGFGLTVTAGTYTAGLALAVRDTLHDLAGARTVLVALATAATVSAVMADPHILVASTTASVAAELADFAVYTPLRDRNHALAIAASGLIGAAVDIVGFLWLAGFPLTTAAIVGQLLVKAVWVTAAHLLLAEGVRRVVSRQRQHPRHPSRHARR